MSDDANLLTTPLYELHLAAGAKMVPFAGYAMPVQYPMGILKEHLHTRKKAGLFDVSHMGQIHLKGGCRCCIRATGSGRYSGFTPHEATLCAFYP